MADWRRRCERSLEDGLVERYFSWLTIVMRTSVSGKEVQKPEQVSLIKKDENGFIPIPPLMAAMGEKHFVPSFRTGEAALDGIVRLKSSGEH